MSDILVLAAHPDDETLGCGATLAKLSQEGHKINLITFTDGVGARNNSSSGRSKQLDRVCDILGIAHYSCGAFPDNKMDTVSMLEVCKFIESNVNFTPNIIFTHHPGCLNIDHSIVSRATLTVFRPQYGRHQEIYSYYVPSSTDYNPLANFNGNVYFDVNKTMDKKIQVLKECYEEELRNFPHTRSIENIINLMQVWGAEVGLAYAEKFQLLRKILR